MQDHFAVLLRDDLGFSEEVVLTPQSGLVTRARPDFFFSLDEGRGILAEVERGGTITNNHDLEDLWKTHVAPDAQHLLLICSAEQLEGGRVALRATLPARDTTIGSVRR